MTTNDPRQLRTQHRGPVTATLDGDAHLHIWEPNAGTDGLDFELTDHLAAVIHLGLGAPPAQEPHWTDTTGTTVIVSLDLGAEGTITVDGSRISERAAVRLAGAGFIELLRTSLLDTAPPADEDHDDPHHDDDDDLADRAAGDPADGNDEIDSDGEDG